MREHAHGEGEDDPQADPVLLRPAAREAPPGDITATVYTANQGIDEWHVLYAWKRDGSLYTVSEHVVSPYSYSRVVENLDRMTKGLVVLQPIRLSALCD